GDVLGAAAGKPKVTQGIVSSPVNLLGLASLGGRYVDLETSTPGVFEPPGTSGPSVTSTSSDTFTLSPLGLTGRNLRLGLLGSSFTGLGFDRLEFKVVENGTTIQDLSFSNPTLASSFFNDHLIPLAHPAPAPSAPIR